MLGVKLADSLKVALSGLSSSAYPSQHRPHTRKDRATHRFQAGLLAPPGRRLGSDPY
jgi:hypothetical protein